MKKTRATPVAPRGRKRPAGKLRRERSGSRERRPNKDGEKRSGAASDVPELNEEEYDEEWEHEWEDIDDIDKSNPKYQKPYGRNQHQKWRGRGQYRGQNRFNKWDHRNQPGSDHGSDSSRRTGRKPPGCDEEENLEMPAGEEMTNLKVKIQDGKRFAEPDEEEDFEPVGGVRNQPKFSRGRGSRGYHGAGRERWNQGNKFKRTAANDLVDCREVLNRRKRHYSDQGECDLREKLLKKDTDLGDLRDIIDSRDPSAADLRDMIEPPDLNFMEEITEDVVGEVDMDEDISLRIRNEYYKAGSKNIDRVDREFEGNNFDAEPYEYVEEQEVTDQITHAGVPLRGRDASRPQVWQQDRWHQRRGGSREGGFVQRRDWAEKSKRDSGPEEEWRGPRSPRSPGEGRIVAMRGRSLRGPNSNSPERKSRDIRSNTSRERVPSPLPKNMRNRSFERGIRSREPSWERERSFESIHSRERMPNIRVQRERRGSFEEPIRIPERGLSQERLFSFNRSGLIQVENNQMNEERRHLRSPPPPQDRGRERNSTRMRSITPEAPRTRSSDRLRRSQERLRGRRSISAERGRAVGGGGNRSLERAGIRNMRDRERSPGQERNWNVSRDENRSIGPERNRSLERVRNRSRERNNSFDRERPRNFEPERKRGQDGPRHSRWDRSRSRDRIPRIERPISPVRERSPHWGGPRTPSTERFRTAGWEQARSPVRNRDRSPQSERSRSRGRPLNIPASRPRDQSRGREIEGRVRDQKEIKALRPKDQERREKVQEQPRRRDFDQTKPQEMQSNRAREPGSIRNVQKEPSSSSKTDRNRKRELEENSSKDQLRSRPRSPDRRGNVQEKNIKKTPQMLIAEFSQRFIRENQKPEKYDRREEFIGKHARANSGQEKKVGSVHNQSDSRDTREWENIRDFQERRVQPAVGLPFLDESRRQRENASRDDVRHQESRGSRNLIVPFVHDNQGHMSNVGDQKKNQPMGWQNPNVTQSYNRTEEDRQRASRWGSPGRRDKASGHTDSHKSTSHSMQSAANTHHPSSNGKAEDDYWPRRDLPSLGESQWNKPRSDLSSNPTRDPGNLRSPPSKSALSPREVIFVRGLARDVSEMDLRKDISNCNLWPKDVRIVYDTDTGVSRGLAFVTFNSVDEATRWMEVRKGVLNLRHNNHAPMDYSNPVSKDWECVRCHSMNFKHRAACFQCNRSKDDCLDGWEETCPYPTHALLLRGLNPLTSSADVIKALKPRMIAHARLDSVKMGVDLKGRPRSVCFVQLTSVVDSMSLHKSLINEPLMIDNCQVIVAYCQLDKLPPMETPLNQIHLSLPVMPSVVPPVIPISLHTTHASLPSSNNIAVVPRAAPAVAAPLKPMGPGVSTASIRSMLEGNYAEKDIPTLAQYCASAYAKNPQEQAAYVRYYTKLYKEKLVKNQTGGK